MQGEPLYFEAHVTIETVSEERFALFRELSRRNRFHVASFTKDTDGPDTQVCTGRSKALPDLQDRMMAIVRSLEAEGFRVTRYKLESTLLDSKIPSSL